MKNPGKRKSRVYADPSEAGELIIGIVFDHEKQRSRENKTEKAGGKELTLRPRKGKRTRAGACAEKGVTVPANRMEAIVEAKCLGWCQLVSVEC